MITLTTGLLLGWLAGAGVDPSPGRQFQTGHLLENIQSESAAGQRFALYLPAGFSPARPTPIIYLMDPRGRARVPAKLFQAAADRFGYILISSNTTASDGPMEPNLRAMQAMWDDTHLWFTIDPRRTYVAGFSGTARTASLLARNRPEGITGIIGAGAGFHPDVKPSAKLPFLYYGTIGDVDYNFHELSGLEDSLAALDLPHRVQRFAGPHSWMTPALAMRAVEWLELRAMQAGSRPRDEALVDAWWSRDEAMARAWLDEGSALDAARRYAAMARDFSGLRETAGVKLAADRVGTSPAARAQLKRRQGEARQFRDWINQGMQTIDDAFPEGAFAPAVPLPDLAQALDMPRLLKTAAAGAPDAAREARRRLNQLEVELGFYLPEAALDRSEFARASYYLSLATQIDSASPVSWYLTAQRYARLNAAQEAFAALTRAIGAGFRDVTLVEADGSFRALRADPGYHAILERLRSMGDDLDTLTVDRPPVSALK